jgi:hypothetical protein
MGWKDSLDAVQELSNTIATGAAASLAPDIAARWNEGPFLWPPDYNYWNRVHPCFLAELTWNLTYFTIISTVQYYDGSGPPRPPVLRSFLEVIPQLPVPTTLSSSSSSSSSTQSNPSWTGSFFNAFKSLIGLDTAPFKAYISRQPDGSPSLFASDLKSIIKCDFNTVQHCTKFMRSLGWGVVVVIIGLGCISIMASKLGIPFVDPLLVIGFFPLTMLFVFGVSPFCFPMVPTCLTSELLVHIEYFLPEHLSWPAPLQHWPGCTDGELPKNQDGTIDFMMLTTATPGTASCMRSCYQWPFDYTSWEDNIAWFSLEFKPSNTLDDWVETHWTPTIDLWFAFTDPYIPLSKYLNGERITKAIRAKRAYVPWADMASAQRTCSMFTAINLVIPVVGLVALLVVALALLFLPLIALQFMFTTLASILTYTHTR